MNGEYAPRRLSELCRIRTGKKDVNQGNPAGRYPFFTCAAAHTFSDEYSFDEEALLVAGNGDVGRVQYYNGKFEAYQRTYVLTGFRHVSPRYLFLLLDGLLKDVISGQKLGNTMPYIKVGMLHDFSVPLPPMEEQRRIVGILDKAFEGIATAKANAEKNLQNARAVFDSYLSEMLSAQRWKVLPLGELCDGVEYGSSAKSETVGKVPVVAMGNIQSGRINWEKLVYTSDTKDIVRYSLKYNDVLFNRTNSLELVGKTAIYKGERPAIFAGYLIRIHRKESLLDADYLNYYLNSEMALEHGKNVAISSVNQANVNGTKLKEYPIPTPALAEQKQIVKSLDKLTTETNRLSSIYAHKADQFEVLKQSLLHQAFSGNL